MYTNFLQTLSSRKSHAHLKRIACMVLLAACVGDVHAGRSDNFFDPPDKVKVQESIKDRSTALHTMQKAAITVTGTVRDSATNETMQGVSVQIAGKSGGTFTDRSGQFTLEVPDPNTMLTFSFVGYTTQSIRVGNNSNLSVFLSKSKNELNDVVVIGYGTRVKGSVTGAISTVKSDVFENRPVTSSFDALQGTIPGLTITKQNGRPGGGNFDLGVRGASSINGNKPLILVDGVAGDINTINVNDIAEVTVLKDAAAAIYGARAADGVIMVTTKRGRKGPPSINITSNLAVKTPAYLRKTMNTLQFAEFLNEGFENVGLATFPQAVLDNIKENAPPNLTQGWMYGLTNFPGFYGYTDWNKEFYQSSTQHIHNVAVSGGGDNNSYLISAGYKRDNGVMRFGENHADGYNLRLNYDVRISPKLSVETRTNFDNQATIAPSQLDAESPIANVIRQFPYAPLYNSVGQFYSYQGYANPAGYATEGGVRTDNFSRFATNFKVDYTIIPDLKITGQAAFRFDYNNYKATFPTFTRWNYAGGVQDIRNNPNSARFVNSKSLNKLYQVYADYNKALGNGHRINLTGGASLEETNVTGEDITGYNFPNNELFSLNLADRTKVAYANFTGSINDQALGSYFGRLSYSYNNKFLLDVSARADGSSKFAPDKRWSAVFPSALFAYVLTNEKFIKNLNTFDLLKLRVSYGRAGNQEIANLGLYDYIPLITLGGTYPIGLPNAGLTGAYGNPASSDRTWETVTNKNIGIDVAVLGSRLNFSFDYFRKTNSDMLVNVAVPATFGATPPSVNQGRLGTKGFEAIVMWKDQINDFKYSVSLQVSDNKNKLLELKNSDVFQEGINETRKGYPINSYFGYVSQGIIKTQAQLDEYKKLQGVPARIAIGDAMYKDLDGDGKLTAFGDQTKGLSGDMIYLGDANPRYTFASNINVAYKGVDLQVFLQGVGKRHVLYGGEINRPNYWFWQSLEYFYGNTYTADNPDAKFPRHLPRGLGFDDVVDHDYKPSTRTIQNVAYLRCKVITIGYNLPERITNLVRFNSARIYVSGQDIFTISKGTFGGNFDPEDGFRNEYTYPFNKVYSIGLNVSF